MSAPDDGLYLIGEDLNEYETCPCVDLRPPNHVRVNPVAALPRGTRQPTSVEDHTLSRTYRRSESDHRNGPRYSRGRETAKPFRCSHCKAMVGPIPYGGRH